MILWCQTASQQMNACQLHYFHEYHSPYCPWISEMIMTWLNWVSFFFICWKQWIRYCGEADVDGSCRPWTEAVDRGRKLSTVNGSCRPWTEVVDRGRKLSTVDGSCRPWTEVVDRGRKLSTVDGRCHASYPSPLSKSLNQFRWSSEIHVERNVRMVW